MSYRIIILIYNRSKFASLMTPIGLSKKQKKPSRPQACNLVAPPNNQSIYQSSTVGNWSKNR